MKKLLQLSVLLSLFFITACEKEMSEENGGAVMGTGDFRADINTLGWIATGLKYANISGGTITLYGDDGVGRSIEMTVADSGTHNYQFASTSLTNIGIFQDSAITPQAAWSTNQWLLPGIYGNLNIREINPTTRTMSGTFNLNVYRSLDDLTTNITNGVFTNIPYTGNIVVPPPVLDDTLQVKVDGVDFVHSSLVSSVNSGVLTITASGASLAPPSVTLRFPDNVTPGTYDFNNSTHVGLYNPSITDFYISSAGTLTILEHNSTTRRIRGNFQFTGTGITPPDVALTAGYFAVTY